MVRPARSVRGSVERRFVRARGLLLLASACAPAVSSGDPQREQRGAEAPAHTDHATLSPAREPEGALELELDGAPLRSADEVVASMPGRADAPAHAERAAWSTDGRTFVHCRAVAGCTECRFIGRDRALQSLESGPACGDGALARADLDARLAEVGLAPPTTRWSAGADVVLVLETRDLEETNAGAPRPMLKLGARRRAGGAPAWLLHIDPCEGCGTDQACAAAAHVDALALSPDGEAFAVLLHQRSTQGDDSLRVELLEATRVAAAARAPASRASF